MKLLWQQKLCNLQQLKNRSFHVPQPTFLFLLETPLRLSRNICCTDGRQFNACQTPRSMYLSVFNSFRVIRCLSQCVTPKIAIFYILVSPGDAPGAITLNVVCMEREFDAYKLSRSTHLSSTISQLFELQVQKIAVFTYRSQHCCFPWRRPVRLSRNMLHGWKDNSMLAKPIAACTYLPSIVSELYDT